MQCSWKNSQIISRIIKFTIRRLHHSWSPQKSETPTLYHHYLLSDWLAARLRTFTTSNGRIKSQHDRITKVLQRVAGQSFRLFDLPLHFLHSRLLVRFLVEEKTSVRCIAAGYGAATVFWAPVLLLLICTFMAIRCNSIKRRKEYGNKTEEVRNQVDQNITNRSLWFSCSCWSYCEEVIFGGKHILPKWITSSYLNLQTEERRTHNNKSLWQITNKTN